MGEVGAQSRRVCLGLGTVRGAAPALPDLVPRRLRPSSEWGTPERTRSSHLFKVCRTPGSSHSRVRAPEADEVPARWNPRSPSQSRQDPGGQGPQKPIPTGSQARTLRSYLLQPRRRAKAPLPPGPPAPRARARGPGGGRGDPNPAGGKRRHQLSARSRGPGLTVSAENFCAGTSWSSTASSSSQQSWGSSMVAEVAGAGDQPRPAPWHCYQESPEGDRGPAGAWRGSSAMLSPPLPAALLEQLPCRHPEVLRVLCVRPRSCQIPWSFPDPPLPPASLPLPLLPQPHLPAPAAACPLRPRGRPGAGLRSERWSGGYQSCAVACRGCLCASFPARTLTHTHTQTHARTHVHARTLGGLPSTTTGRTAPSSRPRVQAWSAQDQPSGPFHPQGLTPSFGQSPDSGVLLDLCPPRPPGPAQSIASQRC